MVRISFEDEEESMKIHCNKRRNQSIENENQNKLQKVDEASAEMCGVENKKSISVTIDPDALECFICFEPLRSPLYQCKNGHVACSVCCTKLPQNKCPTCSHSINFTRCRALEKIIESIKAPCIYANYGCDKNLPYIDISPHQETCTYAPCFCPMPTCTFCGFPEQVSTHFGTYHGNSAIKFRYKKVVKVSLDREKQFVVLREEHGLLFLLLNERLIDRGNALSVACIRQNSEECDFIYKLMVGSEEASLQSKAFAENMRKWVGAYPRNFFLLVPENFFPSDVDISVNVCIQKQRM